MRCSSVAICSRSSCRSNSAAAAALAAFIVMSSVALRSISTATPVRLNAVIPDDEVMEMLYLPTGSAPSE